MIGRLSVIFLLLAVPAFGQSRVYTNADIGKIQRTRTATEEELASLRTHQFVMIPNRPAGPEVIVVHSSTADGPFGPFYMLPSEPLGTPMPFGMPFGMPFWGASYGHRGAGRVTVTVPNLSAPAPITVPPFARGPITVPPPAPAPSAAGHRGRRP